MVRHNNAKQSIFLISKLYTKIKTQDNKKYDTRKKKFLSLYGFASLNACGVWLASPVWMPSASDWLRQFECLRRLRVLWADARLGFNCSMFKVQSSNNFKQSQTISNNLKQLQTISNNLKQFETTSNHFKQSQTTSFTPSNTYPNPCKSVPCPCSDLWIPVSAYGRHRCRPSRGG